MASSECEMLLEGRCTIKDTTHVPFDGDGEVKTLDGVCVRAVSVNNIRALSKQNVLPVMCSPQLWGCSQSDGEGPALGGRLAVPGRKSSLGC